MPQYEVIAEYIFYINARSEEEAESIIDGGIREIVRNPQTGERVFPYFSVSEDELAALAKVKQDD